MTYEETKNPRTDSPFIWPAVEGVKRVEPADLSRFEGEGGPEAPEPATPEPKQQELFAGRDETQKD